MNANSPIKYDEFSIFLQTIKYRWIIWYPCNWKLSKRINNIFIVLILKVQNPQQLVDFWPISMVRCMYKVLAKVLANKLRNSQSIFIKGRQILDGILIANEVVDDTWRLKKGVVII